MPWKIDPETGEQLTVSDMLAEILLKGAKSRRGSLPWIQEIIRTVEGSKVKIEGGEEVGTLGSMPLDDLLRARAALIRRRADDERE